MLLEDPFGSVISLVNNALDLLVDPDGSILTVVPVLGNLSAEKDRLLFLSESDWSHGLAHAIDSYHLAGYGGCFFYIITGTAGFVVEDQLFRDPAAH